MSVKTIAVVPAYNESSTIASVVKQTRKHVDKVLVVDDGSTDNTTKIARNHGATVVTHTINTGVGGAVRTGYRHAIREDYDYVVQIDADGQHDPEYIPKLLDVASECEMVIGSRYLNSSFSNYSIVRRTGIRFFTSLVNVLGNVEITDVTSGFRVYDVDALQEIIHESDRHWAVEQTLEAARRNYRIEEISIEMPPRLKGESQFDFSTFTMYPIRMTDVLLRILLFR